MVRVAIWRRLITIGIRREKNVWESRVPLTPSHVQRLLAQKKDLEFIVQPSHTRVFTDHEFAEVQHEQQAFTALTSMSTGWGQP